MCDAQHNDVRNHLRCHFIRSSILLRKLAFLKTHSTRTQFIELCPKFFIEKETTEIGLEK